MILYDSTQEPLSFTTFTGFPAPAGLWWGSSLESDVGGAPGTTTPTGEDGTTFVAAETEIVRAPGNIALRTELRRQADTLRWFRAEVIGTASPVNRQMPGVGDNAVYWYAFSLMSIDNVPDGNAELVFQTHNGAALSGTAPGIQVAVRDGKFYFQNKYSEDGVTPVTGAFVSAGPVIQDRKWYDIVIEHKLDWLVAGVGYCRFWINGMPYLSANVPTTIPADAEGFDGPYLKCGLYKSVWASEATNDGGITERKYIIDEFRIGDSSESVRTMRPRTPNPLPPIGAQDGMAAPLLSHSQFGGRW